MKAMKTCLCIVLTVLVLLSSFACSDIMYEEGQTSEPDGSGDLETNDTGSIVEENNVLNIVSSGMSEFTIVYPALCDSSIKELAQKVQTTIKDYTGAELELHSDSEESEFEILIGDTDRDESLAVLKGIREKEGIIYVGEKKLVLVGGTEEYLKKAVAKFFKSVYASGKKGDTAGNLQVTSGDNASECYKYPVAREYSINGSFIGDYIIIYDKDSIIAKYGAYVMQRTVLERIGYKLPVYSDTENRADKEILVGMTSRTEGSVPERTFALELQGSKLCLKFNDEVACQEQMIDYINNKVLIGGTKEFNARSNYSARLDDILTGSERSILGNTGDIRIICNNIYQSYNWYEERMTYLTMVYEEYAPDVICLQEAGPASWGKSDDKSVHVLMQKLGYETITAGGTTQNINNATPMIYNKSTLELLDCGYFIYSLENNSNSKSYTWGLFKVKATGKTFICFSTHFMYNSGISAEYPEMTYEQIRVNNAKELEEKMKELYATYNCPIFGGGDINSTWDGEAYKYMINTAGFKNVRDIADVSDEHIGTCHATGALDEESKFFFDYLGEEDIKGEIDTLFAYGDESTYHVNTHDVLIHDFTAAASDHLPVLADIVLK